MAKHKIFSLRSLVTPAIVLGMTGYFLVICVEGLRHTYVEEGWLTAPGIILGKDVELTGKDNIRRKAEALEQAINYEYTVAGVSYRSNSVSPNVTVDAGEYPEGKQVTVYYNPADAAQTVLARSEVPKQYLYAVIAFCALIIAVVFYYVLRDFLQRT